MAGIYALAGAWLAHIDRLFFFSEEYATEYYCNTCVSYNMVPIAIGVFVAAFFTAVIFSIIKSKKEGVAIWGGAARRLLWNTLLPIAVGGVFIWRMLSLKYYVLLVPAALIFYGLAMVNGSRYTRGEIRYMGYVQIVIGIVCLNSWQLSMYGWVLGFGVMHIIYGAAMWWKYERKQVNEQ
ncbi:hypothetical protein FLA_0821 [Filimonas lacunae]|nr:hypothetical protein FLA_0821 [Filimonas lacunae]